MTRALLFTSIVLSAALNAPAIADDPVQLGPLNLKACENQISWCDKNDKASAPTSAEIAQQCSLFPSTCKNGEAIEIADSGCVDPEGWANYCTDRGKLRDPTPAEIEYMQHCGETIDGVYYQCE